MGDVVAIRTKLENALQQLVGVIDTERYKAQSKQRHRNCASKTNLNDEGVIG